MTRRSDRGPQLPLLAWGDQLRAERANRRRLGRRVAIIGLGITVLGLTAAFPPAPRLVWNASASAPIGLYAVTPGAEGDPGDMVIARVPDPSHSVFGVCRVISGSRMIDSGIIIG